MPFLIRYFRAGREQGSTPWDGSLDMMEKIAADGMVRHGMDRAVIADDAGTIVWSSGEEASEAPKEKRGFGIALRHWLRRIVPTQPTQF